jgi:hypothetical protein
MLFMDWRDDHLADLPEVKARNDKLPTFLYAMPFTKNKVGTVKEKLGRAVLGGSTHGHLFLTGQKLWARGT